MTSDRPLLSSPLGRRLLAAFLLVALSSVAVLTLAALIGSDRGLASAERAERQQVAARVAAAAADAYTRAGDWAGADLDAANAIADAAGARLIVRDSAGAIAMPRGAMGPGWRGMHADGTGEAIVTAPITVAAQPIGTARLAFPASAPGGRTVAWAWVGGAAVVALVAALIVSRFVARRLIRPLARLAGAARRFAKGERTARARVAAPGELGEVANAFDTMADEVVHAETVRRRLAADIAHELRTPLAALQAGLEELRDGLQDPDPPRLAALHDQSLRLGRVVQDLADLSAAESAALTLHVVDVNLTDIARAALAAQRPQLHAAGLRVDTDLTASLPVCADPDRVHQVIANLLANAARYCRSGDGVLVRGYRAGSSAVIEVADTGPGIPAEELPYLFDRLWRGRQASTVTGSGIGLAVVRELVTAHGGTVEVTSPPGGGVTMTVRLPLASRPSRLPGAN